MRRTPYLTRLIFPASLEFRNATLGLRRRVLIGDLRGTLTLPRANNDGITESFSELLPPRVKNIEFLERVYAHSPDNEVEPRIYWGQYFAWNRHDPIGTAVASVRSAALTFAPSQGGHDMSVRKVAERCLADLPAWCSRLVDWVELLTGVDADPRNPLDAAIVPPSWVSPAWVYPTASGPDYDYFNAPVVLLGSTGEHALDTTNWSKAVRAANARQDLPEIWALLRDARRAQRRRNPRRTILDAATATELIVDRQLRVRLRRDNPQALVERLMKDTWQMQRRTRLMTTLGMWLPPDLDTKLLFLRNRVVHGNAPVTRGESAAALEVAEALARRYEMPRLK